MSAKDKYHEAVKQALIKEGWTITADPYTVVLTDRFLFIDLQAENTAQGVVILIEVKTFEHPSPIEALAAAIGKYNLYIGALDIVGIKDALYLALPEAAFEGILSEDIGQWLISHHALKLIVINVEHEEVVKWIP